MHSSTPRYGSEVDSSWRYDDDIVEVSQTVKALSTELNQEVNTTNQHNPPVNPTMDGQSNGLGKLLPKAIAAKRRRNRGSSTSELSSMLDGIAPQGGGIASRSTPGSDANSVSSLNGSLKSTNTDPAVYDSDPDS